MKHPILVYDFETDGKIPEICQPVEVAGLVIDNYTLELIPNSEFSSMMRPNGIDDPEYFTDAVMDTIKWHARLRGCSSDEIIESWKNAPPQETVWRLFHAHVEKYNKKAQQGTAPIAAGMNIKNFDNIITARLNEQYKINRMFNHAVVDLRDLALLWLSWDWSLKSHALDSLREYLGLPKHDKAHTALADTKDCAIIIARFLKYHKAHAGKNKFKGAFGNDS